ncbi:hypothetical protein PVAG01_05193 [Phlyctema vagabunda]|uniref:Uncharacterized protein n=1 Tax=Phlyctema vagabunda TaxID=108571 RepID=A0ABR4PJE1_9HELO
MDPCLNPPNRSMRTATSTQSFRSDITIPDFTPPIRSVRSFASSYSINSDNFSDITALNRSVRSTASSYSIRPEYPAVLPTRYRDRILRQEKVVVGSESSNERITSDPSSNNSISNSLEQKLPEKNRELVRLRERYNEEEYEKKESGVGIAEDKYKEVLYGGRKDLLDLETLPEPTAPPAVQKEHRRPAVLRPREPLPDFVYPIRDSRQDQPNSTSNGNEATSLPSNPVHYCSGQPQSMNVASDGLLKLGALKDKISSGENLLREVADHPTRSSLTHKGKDIANHLQDLSRDMLELIDQIKSKTLFAGIDRCRVSGCFDVLLNALGDLCKPLEDVDVLSKAVKRGKSRRHVLNAVKCFRADCFTFFGHMTKEVTEKEIRRIEFAMTYLNRCESAWKDLVTNE